MAVETPFTVMKVRRMKINEPDSNNKGKVRYKED